MNVFALSPKKFNDLPPLKVKRFNANENLSALISDLISKRHEQLNAQVNYKRYAHRYLNCKHLPNLKYPHSKPQLLRRRD